MSATSLVPSAIEALVAFFLKNPPCWTVLLRLGKAVQTPTPCRLGWWRWALASLHYGSAKQRLDAKPDWSEFNYQTMRMEWPFRRMVLNPVAQVKFLHTVASAYTCGAMFVLGVSSYYLWRSGYCAAALFAVAASFGIASIISVIVLGDESGYELGDCVKVKLAAIEAEWHWGFGTCGTAVYVYQIKEEGKTDFCGKNPLCDGNYCNAIFGRASDGASWLAWSTFSAYSQRNHRLWCWSVCDPGYFTWYGTSLWANQAWPRIWLIA